MENYDEEQKAELADSQVEEQRQHDVDVRPELDGHTFSAAVAEWEQQDGKSDVNEMDAGGDVHGERKWTIPYTWRTQHPLSWLRRGKLPSSWFFTGSFRFVSVCTTSVNQ